MLTLGAWPWRWSNNIIYYFFFSHHSRCKWGTLISGSIRTCRYWWAAAWERLISLASSACGWLSVKAAWVDDTLVSLWHGAITLDRGRQAQFGGRDYIVRWASSFTKGLARRTRDFTGCQQSSNGNILLFSTSYFLLFLLCLHLSLGFTDLCSHSRK